MTVSCLRRFSSNVHITKCLLGIRRNWSYRVRDFTFVSQAVSKHCSEEIQRASYRGMLHTLYRPVLLSDVPLHSTKRHYRVKFVLLQLRPLRNTEILEVIGTGTIGWLLNVVLILCSGP